MSSTEKIRLVTVLGSTGSIGINTLKVIALHPERYRIFALTAATSVDTLLAQCLEFRPDFAVLAAKEEAGKLRGLLKQAGLQTSVLHGAEGLEQVAADPEVDIVMAAIVGGAGLLPTIAAARAGKKVLLANKEALVMAGDIFMQAAMENSATILPIDSEHNAIFQCLPVEGNALFRNRAQQGFEKIVLTASGGPFRNMHLSALAEVTPAQACAHPNWVMGRKISVDSATMVNKALELIEASYLFNLPATRIEILLHPQSIIHSLVYYTDGSVLAQLGNPDMRTPIAYGLAWPDRITAGVETLDLVRIAKLEFEEPDPLRFPALALGLQVAGNRGAAPVIFNAANEIAVAAFLDGQVGFDEIPVIIDRVLQSLDAPPPTDLETVLETDQQARKAAGRMIAT